MWPYIVLILLALLCASTDISPVKNRIVITLPFILLMFAMAAFRDNMGGFDYEMYSYYYEHVVGVRDYFRGLYEPFFRSKSFEEGFIILSSVIRSLDFTQGPCFFFFMIALVSFSIFLSSLKEYTPFVYIAILFYLYKAYFWHDYTLTRQSIAIALFTFSIRYIYRKEYLKYIAFNLVAFSMHHSAIILFPLCFFMNYKFSIKSILIMILVAIIFGMTGSFAQGLCVKLAEMFNLGNRFTSYLVCTGTINPLNFLEIFVILFFALFYRNFYESKEPYFNIFLNLFLFSSLILIAFSSFELFSRFKEYFVVAYMILISYMVGHIQVNKIRWIVFGFLSLYVMVGYFRYIIIFGFGDLLPYRWVLW